MKTITTAQNLISKYNDDNDLMTQADLLTDNVDQDYENESTTYNFDDGSFLKINSDFSNEVG